MTCNGVPFVKETLPQGASSAPSDEYVYDLYMHPRVDFNLEVPHEQYSQYLSIDQILPNVSYMPEEDNRSDKISSFKHEFDIARLSVALGL